MRHKRMATELIIDEPGFSQSWLTSTHLKRATSTYPFVRRYVRPGRHDCGNLVGVTPLEVSNLHSLLNQSTYPTSLKKKRLLVGSYDCRLRWQKTDKQWKTTNSPALATAWYPNGYLFKLSWFQLSNQKLRITPRKNNSSLPVSLRADFLEATVYSYVLTGFQKKVSELIISGHT